MTAAPRAGGAGEPGAGALRRLAELLREDGSVIADHLTEPPAAADPDAAGAGAAETHSPAFGGLAAAGPRAAEAPADYALLVEAVREGYLLHYGEPRVVVGADEDLRLLAGDYLYAIGLERLAGFGDLEAVRELADLISISAQLHAERAGAGAGTLWLASAVAVAAGASPAHEAAKGALRAGEPGAERALLAAASESAAGAGLADALARARESIESGC